MSGRFVHGMDKQQNRKLREGDETEFSVLFRQTHPRMMGYCQLFVKDKSEAEDIVQDCFYSLWENRKKIDTEKSVESLLFVSLRNRCLNYLKENSRYTFNSLNDQLIPNELQYLYQIDLTDKRELSLEERLVESLKSAIDELPERKKQILIKSKMEGLKQKEIAEELGISVKTVEKHLAEAKAELRIKLEKQFASLSIIIYLMIH